MGTKTQDAKKHTTRTENTKRAERKDEPKQDTPGRAKPSSSRQQTQPDQGTQTGTPLIDAGAKTPDDKNPNKKAHETEDTYRDRPADDGKHGDGHQEPNAGFPSRNE